MQRGLELFVRGVGLGSLRALGVVSRTQGQAWSRRYLHIRSRSFHLAVECQGKLFTFSNIAQTPMYFWSRVLCKKAGRNLSRSRSGVETQSPG